MNTNKFIILVATSFFFNILPSEIDRNTQLLKAAQAGDLSLVSEALSHGADINIKDKNNYTALYYAAEYGYLELAKLLIDNKSSLTEEIFEFCTPIYWAKLHGNDDIAKLLLDNGAKYDLNILLFLASSKDLPYSLKILEGALKNEFDINLHLGENGITLLQNACFTKNIKAVNLLISLNANVNATADDGGTALHFLLNSDSDYNNKISTEIFHLLINRGADINVLYENINLAFYALICSKFDIFEYLEKNNINANVNVNELFIEAASAGNIKLLEYCFKHFNMNVDEPKDENNSNALHWAAKNGRFKIVEFLINNKADIHLKNNFGNTPLHCAATSNCGETILLLKSLGANLEEENNSGETPTCLLGPYSEPIIAFISVGALFCHPKVQKVIENIRNKLGLNGPINRCLSTAILTDNIKYFKHLIDSNKVNKDDFNRIAIDFIPLHLAIYSKKLEFVQKLLDHNRWISVTNAISCLNFSLRHDLSDSAKLIDAYLLPVRQNLIKLLQGKNPDEQPIACFFKKIPNRVMLYLTEFICGARPKR